jgi:hypothetical protein
MKGVRPGGPEDGSFVTTGEDEGEGEDPTVSQSGEGEGPTVCPTTGNVEGLTGFATTGEGEGVRSDGQSVRRR